MDDEELIYCINILDEIFGRKNRINIVTFKQGSAVGHKAINPGLVTVTNFIIIYALDKMNNWKPNRLFTRRERDSRYSSFIENINENYRDWRLVPLLKAFERHHNLTLREIKNKLGEEYETALNDFVIINAGRVVQPVPPSYDGVGQTTRDLINLSKKNPEQLYLQERDGYSDIYLKNGKRWLFYKDKLKKIDGEIVSGEPLTNLWDDLLSNNLHNEGDVKFPKGKKPEALVKRIFELFSEKGDLVLDSFLGSGTTAAVAHKMGRRYIGIEMGEHAVTHCAPRLRKVIEGEQGGISEAVGWKGGGGFRFYRLGDPVFDEAGHISPGIRFAPLAAHVWFIETGVPFTGTADSPLLGIHDGTAYYLLYNGILGDKRPNGGNVLTAKILAALPPFDGPRVIFGEGCRMSAERLENERITFRQIPYEIKAR